MHSVITEAELAEIRVNSFEAPYEPRRDVVPDKWTPDHLSVRLVEAFETMGRMPRPAGPRQPGNQGPSYNHDHADIAGRLADPLTRKDFYEERNNRKLMPTMLEIGRMEQCLEFLRRYDGVDSLGARVLTRWAFAKATGRQVAKEAPRLNLSKSQFYTLRERALNACAATLNRVGVGVF